MKLLKWRCQTKISIVRKKLSSVRSKEQLFLPKIGNSMCNALIDTGATKSGISEKYYQKHTINQNPYHKKHKCKISHRQ